MLTDDDLRIISSILDTEEIQESFRLEEWNGSLTLLDIVKKYLPGRTDLIQAVEDNPRLRALVCADRNEHMSWDEAQMVTLVDAFGNPIVAYQGTKTFSDWIADGGLLLIPGLTPRQSEAIRYARQVYEKYHKQIIAVGHSLGGNLAQCVTIYLGDIVSRCVAFNALGFNAAFLSEYATSIGKYRSKITRYEADQDVVSKLQGSIAGEVIHVDGEEIFYSGAGNVLGEHGMSNFSELQGGTGDTRDFSDAKREELKAIIREINSEFPLDFTHWDINYRIEDEFFSRLDPQNYRNNMQCYCRKRLDIDGTTETQIDCLFSRANATDNIYCHALKNSVIKPLEAVKTKVASFFIQV